MMHAVFFKGIYLFVVFMCVCLHTFMCTRHVSETMEAIWMIVFESGPTQEQQVLLMAEPHLQTLHCVFSYMYDFFFSVN